MVATQNVAKYAPPVTVSFRFPIAPAPVPVPLRLPAVAAATALKAPDAADVVVTEPQVPERPQLPTEAVRISDSSDDSLFNDCSQGYFILSETPLGIDPVEQRLPAEAMPTDW